MPRRLAAELVPKQRRGSTGCASATGGLYASSQSPREPLLPLGAPDLWGRPPLTCPVPTGSEQQGEETLHCRLLGDREVPAGACDLCGRLPSQQPLGTGQDCFWGQGTQQDGGGLCEYGPLPRPTSLGISAPGRGFPWDPGCHGDGRTLLTLLSQLRAGGVPLYSASVLAGTFGDHLRWDFQAFFSCGFLPSNTAHVEAQNVRWTKAKGAGRWRPVHSAPPSSLTLNAAKPPVKPTDRAPLHSWDSHCSPERGICPKSLC